MTNRLLGSRQLLRYRSRTFSRFSQSAPTYQMLHQLRGQAVGDAAVFAAVHDCLWQILLQKSVEGCREQ
jgi:hypothetical protein